MRAYMFDVDHNLSTIDKPVFLEKDGIHFDIGSKHAGHKRYFEGYTRRNNDGIAANSHFRDDGILGTDTFPAFIQETLENGAFGPSIDKFKEALVHAAPIAVNTARGHDSQYIHQGMYLFIQGILSEDEKSKMHKAIHQRWSQHADFAEALQQYLSFQFFLGVGSDEFLTRYPEMLEQTGQTRKTKGIELFIKHVMSIRDQFYPEDTNISIGFSDDERQNIDRMLQRGEENLEFLQSNNIHFVCYNTGEKPQKHRVTKKSHHL